MPEPESAPDALETARRWAVRFSEGAAGTADLESAVAELAREFQARQDTARIADDRFTTLYVSCPFGLVLTDETGRVVMVNPAFARLIGVAEEDLLGTAVLDLGAGEHDRQVLRSALEDADDTGSTRIQHRLTIAAADGPAKPVRLTITSLPGEDGGYPTLVFEDIQELSELRETFYHQGLHDPLTGLPNGAHFASRLEKMLTGGVGQQVALMYLDIDGFKVVNDGLGSDAADRVLRGVAGRLRQCFAAQDAVIARLLGDGFAVAFAGELAPSSVVKLAEQAIEELAEPVYVDDIGVGVSVSIGIVVLDALGVDHRDMMRSAEVALHRAKTLGKAQWVLFDPEAERVDRERYRLASSIGGALETGEITVAYQPHVVLPDAQIVVSMNAALRWDHPTLGLLTPETFYPLAETTGMTVPLGRRLLRDALETTADWRVRFGDQAPMVCLTLPGRMAIDGDLVGMVRSELSRYELEPSHLMLCVDAAALLDERGDLVESLGYLAKLGVVFVLNISGPTDLELIPALDVPAPGTMLRGPIIDATVGDAPEWARRNIRQLVQRAEELDVKVGAYGIRSEEHAALLFELGLVVGSGDYLPEYVARGEAEEWVGKTFPMG